MFEVQYYSDRYGVWITVSRDDSYKVAQAEYLNRQLRESANISLRLVCVLDTAPGV